MKKISVVILNWNGNNFLKKFMPSVINNTPAEIAEIIVADNGSSDDSLSFLREKFPEVRIIELNNNYGYAEGYNRAMSDVFSEYSVLLNSDVEVSPGWLDAMCTLMERESSVSAVMPKILSYAQKTHFEYAGACGGFMDLFGFPFCRGRMFRDIEQDRGQYDQAVEVLWASGAAIMVRTSLFKSLGGFDADFFAHMEEIDLCWRMRNNGYRVVVEPRSVVYHLGGGTLPNESPYKLYLNFRNSLYTLYKNLPGRLLFPVIFTRLLIDGAIAAMYMLQSKPQNLRSLFLAHIAFYKSLKKLKTKRRSLHKPQRLPKVIYHGFIFFLKLKPFRDAYFRDITAATESMTPNATPKSAAKRI